MRIRNKSITFQFLVAKELFLDSLCTTLYLERLANLQLTTVEP